MNGFKILMLLLLTGLMFSCTSQKQEGQDYSEEIDSMLTKLRVLGDSLDSLNIREVQQINKSYWKYYDTAQVRDTQDIKFRLYEKSQNILKWYGNVNREINYSRSHLKSIKEEFKNEDIPDSTKKKKLKEEKQIVSSIQKRFEKEYQSLKKEVEALLNRKSIDE
ncbi:MAG: hypothetical protein ACLFM7_00235 [Bacteroidales bacterium]